MDWSRHFCALAAGLAVSLIGCGGPASDDWPRAADLTTLATVARIDSADALKTTADSLALAGGREVELFFEVASPAVLRIERLAGRGGGSGPVLQVAAQRDGGALEELVHLGPTDDPVEVALPDGPLPLRLVLRTPPGPGAVLFSPEIRIPPEVSGTSATSSEAAGPRAGRTPSSEVPDTSAERPNLLIYMVDTLRADHLGLYGYPRPTSPRLDEFATRPGSVVFDDAQAVSSWTRPTVASILTGLAPDVHGVHGRRDRLPDEVDTLAEILEADDYRTGAVVANLNVARRFGFAQGFESFRWLRTSNNRSDRVHAEGLAWLDQAGGDEPFFLYLHTVDPHSAYTPPAAERQRFAPDVPVGPVGTRPWLRQVKDDPDRPTADELRALSDLYDAEVAANDRTFGDLLDALDARGLLEDTVVVFVSDHGEEFGERGGLEHGRTLHAEQLHVPLVIRLPWVEAAGRRVGHQVDQLDLLPTLLAVLGLPERPELAGRDLSSWLTGGVTVGSDDAHRTLAWLDLDGHRQASVTEPAWKLIAPQGEPLLLYDRRSDPAETRDRAGERPVRAGLLDAVLAFRRLHPGTGLLDGGEAELDAEAVEELRALGYLR